MGWWFHQHAANVCTTGRQNRLIGKCLFSQPAEVRKVACPHTINASLDYGPRGVRSSSLFQQKICVHFSWLLRDRLNIIVFGSSLRFLYLSYFIIILCRTFPLGNFRSTCFSRRQMMAAKVRRMEGRCFPFHFHCLSKEDPIRQTGPDHWCTALLHINEGAPSWRRLTSQIKSLQDHLEML